MVMAVRLTERVMFDFEMEEMRLDTFPPGQAATKIIPMATEVEGRKRITNKKVSAGRSTYWAMTPNSAGLGLRISVLKCLGLMLNATPNMMNAMAIFIKLMLPSLKFNRTASSCSRFPNRDSNGVSCIVLIDFNLQRYKNMHL